MSKVAGIVAALKTLMSADPKDISSVVEDPEISKALKDLKATDLSDAQLVRALWQNGELMRPATKEEVKTGPEQATSGNGAERMIRDYSSPAAQMGIQLMAEEFGRALAPMSASMKAISQGMAILLENQGKLPTQLTEALVAAEAAAKAKKAKKAEGEDEEDEEDEESEVVEINASKAQRCLRKAKQLLRKIDIAKAEMEEAEEDDDKDAKKAARKAIKSLELALSHVLGDARMHAYAASSAELKKSVRTIAVKADIDVVQEEEEEDDEEEEDGKSKKAKAAKAAADAAKSAEEAAAKAAAEAKAKPVRQRQSGRQERLRHRQPGRFLRRQGQSRQQAR